MFSYLDPQRRRFVASATLGATIGVVTLTATGCAAPPAQLVDDRSVLTPTRSTSAPTHRQLALAEHYARWRGTRYRFGGQRRDGIDCSGFVQRTYAEVFGVRVPRTTSAQRYIGAEVASSALQVGDLIFFDTDAKDSHVGIYAGDGRFIHASVRRGVTHDHVDGPYWSTRRSAVVRVLPSSS